MTIGRRGLRVKVMGEANAVGPTSIEGSFYSYLCAVPPSECVVPNFPTGVLERPLQFSELSTLEMRLAWTDARPSSQKTQLLYGLNRCPVVVAGRSRLPLLTVGL